MVQKRVVLLEDDIDGTEASETVRFGLDSIEYEIDLNNEHSTELRDALGRYIAAGRRVSGARSKSSHKVDGNDSRAIRRWAVRQGFPVNSRGRIQAHVVERYYAAHSSPSVR
jgi:hypothetical protein